MTGKCYYCDEQDIEVEKFEWLTICIYCKNLYEFDKKEAQNELPKGNDMRELRGEGDDKEGQTTQLLPAE